MKASLLISFCLVLQSSEGQLAGEIGIRSKADNAFVPIGNGEMIGKISGTFFEAYCKADNNIFNVCIWSWKQDESRYCTLTNDSPDSNCPGQVRRVDNDKCVIEIDSYEAAKHQGLWECALIVKGSNGLSISSNLTLSFATLVGTQVILDQNEISVKEKEEIDLKCQTSSQVYLPKDGVNLIKWKINNNYDYDNAQVVQETSSDCVQEKNYDSKCIIESTLRYSGRKKDYEISCFAEQYDSFGDLMVSQVAYTDITIIEEDGIDGLSKGAKAGIVLAVIIPLIVIIICILAFICGWCCFKRRREDNHLEVNDQPQQPSSQQLIKDPSFQKIEEPFYVRPDDYRPIQQNYQQWPIPPPIYLDDYIEPPHDEFLIYKWEGFGRPHSDAGSLSSLESFGHVDDLDLNIELLRLGGLSISSPTTSDDSISTSSMEAEFEIPVMTDSWV